MGDPVMGAWVKVVRSGARDEHGDLPAEVWREEQTAPTLNAFDNGSESRATVLVDHAFDSTWSGRYPIADGRLSPTVKVGTTIDTAAPPAISGSMGVRRLTPRECERLMGWPDDHTRWDAGGNELPDSVRYRMCGNGVVAPVARWIAERLGEAL